MTELERAWHLRVNMGYTYAQIGDELHYSTPSAYRLITGGFKRLSSAKIYTLAQEFCFETCDGAGCRDCKLSEFVVSRLIKKL